MTARGKDVTIMRIADGLVPQGVGHPSGVGRVVAATLRGVPVRDRLGLRVAGSHGGLIVRGIQTSQPLTRLSCGRALQEDRGYLDRMGDITTRLPLVYQALSATVIAGTALARAPAHRSSSAASGHRRLSVSLSGRPGSAALELRGQRSRLRGEAVRHLGRRLRPSTGSRTANAGTSISGSLISLRKR